MWGSTPKGSRKGSTVTVAKINRWFQGSYICAFWQPENDRVRSNLSDDILFKFRVIRGMQYEIVKFCFTGSKYM